MIKEKEISIVNSQTYVFFMSSRGGEVRKIIKRKSNDTGGKRV